MLQYHEMEMDYNASEKSLPLFAMRKYHVHIKTQRKFCPLLSFSFPIEDTNETTWQYLLDLYMEIVGPTEASSFIKSNESGLQVSYKVVHIPGKGRGLVATASVNSRPAKSP